MTAPALATWLLDYAYATGTTEIVALAGPGPDGAGPAAYLLVRPDRYDLLHVRDAADPNANPAVLGMTPKTAREILSTLAGVFAGRLEGIRLPPKPTVELPL